MGDSLRGRVIKYDKGSREILYRGKPISREDVRTVKSIQKINSVPTYHERFMERYYIESWIWTMLGQRIHPKTALNAMKNVHKVPMDQLRDPEVVYGLITNKSQQLGFWGENKLRYSFDYIRDFGGVVKIVKNFLESPHEVREDLTGIKWVGHITATRWYSGLKGKDNLVILDFYNSLQAARLGVKVPTYAYQKGKNGIRSLSNNAYLEVEKRLIDFLISSNLIKRHPKEFLNKNGELDGSFVSTFLKWMAFQNQNGGNPNQLDLLNIYKDALVSPYSISFSRTNITPEMKKNMARDVYVRNLSKKQVMEKYGISKSSFSITMDEVPKMGLVFGGLKIDEELRQEWKDNATKRGRKALKDKYGDEGISILMKIANSRKTPEGILKAAKAGGKKTQELHGSKVQKNLKKRGDYRKNFCTIDGITYDSESEARLAIILQEFGVVDEWIEGENVHKKFITLEYNEQELEFEEKLDPKEAFYRELEQRVEEEDDSFPFGANVKDNSEEEGRPAFSSRGEVDFFINGTVLEYHPITKNRESETCENIEDYVLKREEQLSKVGFDGKIIAIESLAGYNVLYCLNELGIDLEWKEFIKKYVPIKDKSREIVKESIRLEKEKKSKELEEEAPF